MAETALVGVFEIAEMANVSASAVANWRKRFPDFPAPLAELKSDLCSERVRSNSGWQEEKPLCRRELSFFTTNSQASAEIRLNFEKR